MGLCALSILVAASILTLSGTRPSRAGGEETRKVKPRSAELQCGEKETATPKDKHKSIKVTNTGAACDVKVTVTCNEGASPPAFTLAPVANATKDCAEGKQVKTVNFECLTSTKKEKCKYEWELLN
jgi:hypothetical protein